MRFARNQTAVTLRDRTRSEDVREELKMKRINENIGEYQKWTQYVERMDNNGVTRVIMNCKPDVLRDLGRPRSGWQDQSSISVQTLFLNFD
jgi:hypothetical protein